MGWGWTQPAIDQKLEKTTNLAVDWQNPADKYLSNDWQCLDYQRVEGFVY